MGITADCMDGRFYAHHACQQHAWSFQAKRCMHVKPLLSRLPLQLHVRKQAAAPALIEGLGVRGVGWPHVEGRGRTHDVEVGDDALRRAGRHTEQLEHVVVDAVCIGIL